MIFKESTVGIFSLIRRFAISQRGSIVPLFGFMLLAVVISIGIAVDMARGTRVSVIAGGALDAAALAAAKSLRLDGANDAELLALANDYFDANFDAIPVSSRQITAQIDRVNHGVTLVANLQIPSTLAGIVGQDTIEISKSAAAVYDVRNVEVSMMLDVSGSMAGTKIADLKTAAGELVDILMDANANGTEHKIAIAPFSTSVNGGAYADVIGTRFDRRGRAYAGSGTTCMSDRSGTNAFNDADPRTGTFNMRASSCPQAAVMPLSNDRDALKDKINSLRAEGMTAGHLGAAWAWYLLSPHWATLWPGDSEPVGYDEPEYQKVAILMTDGIFNTAYESANGNSEAQARLVCTNMKNAGVTVFTVGFQVPREVLPILQHCATSPKHFFDATSGEELRQTFRTIAQKLNGLRLAS
jgi:Flp pilus assembly protein TadG